VNVVVLNDDVAEIDADPEYDLLILGHSRVPLRHPTLDRDGLDNTWELHQQTVAHRLDDAALVFGDFRIDEFAAVGSEPGRVPASSWPMRRL
jgi:hypothetical protein